MYEHHCRCHLPHDPKLCDACIRARLMGMKHTTHGDAHKVKGVEKGYVCNMDFIGPYPPDIDDNVWGMVNVECGTNYGQVALLHDKESTTALNSFKQQRALLKREGGKDIVRVHHDCDKSFDGEFKGYLQDNLIEITHTGGYNPQSSGIVERRNRAIKQAFKAALFYATGGLPYYNALWGPGIKFAMEAINKNNDSSGRNYYKNIKGEEYKYDIGNSDLAFGQQVFYHISDAQKEDHWETNGKEAIWVGRSDEINNGHVVVPIVWDPDTKVYELKPTKHVTHVRWENIHYPLKMGPVHQAIDDNNIEGNEAKLDVFVEDFFRPWYKATESGEGYQIEGEDPIMELEAIEGQSGKGNKLKYLVKWKGSEVRTYEPVKHLEKYGASESIEEYKASIKLKASEAKAKKLAESEAKHGSKKKAPKLKHSKENHVSEVRYCNYTNKVIMNDNDEEIVKILMEKQRKKGKVSEWLQSYKDELEKVKSTRMNIIPLREVSDEVRRNAIPMRMILEEKRDGRKKGRLVVIGFREPYSHNERSNSSPVSDMSTVKSLLYKAGSPDDVICSIDVSVAFLQSDPYPSYAPKRYVKYQPHKLWLHRVEMKVLLEITFLRKINLKFFFAPKSRKGSIVRQIYKKS